MDIDWLVAIAVFLFFTIWAFSYFFTLIESPGNPLGTAADVDFRKVMDYLAIDSYSAPVKYTSPSSGAAVVYAYNPWTNGERSVTRVRTGSGYADCIISGDNLYWQADVQSGDNWFYIETAGINSSVQNCSGSFALDGAVLAVPWAMEKSVMFSSGKISNMSSMGYDSFTSALGIREGLRIVTDMEGVETTFGKTPPQKSDVFVRRGMGRIWETGEPANITVLVWSG